MKANTENVKVGDTIIFKCDEYNNGDIQEFSGQVQYIDEKGVGAIYLSGYRSRNDDIPFEDIFAVLDKSKPWIELKYAPFNGHFIEFDCIGEWVREN